MLKSNGFAVVEVVLVVVVVVALSFAGWTWWSMQQNQDTANIAQLEKKQQKVEEKQNPDKKTLIKAAAKSYCVGADFIGCNPKITKQTENSAAVRVTNENPNGGKRNVLIGKNELGAWRAVLAANSDICSVGSNAPELKELCNR